MLSNSSRGQGSSGYCRPTELGLQGSDLSRMSQSNIHSCCMTPRRSIALCLGLVLLLAAPSGFHGSLQPANVNTKALMQELIAYDKEASQDAYNQCKQQHGTSCQVPCDSMPGCAGCHPSDIISAAAGGSPLTCAFAMPGYALSADGSVSPCPPGTFSKGGKASSCSSCPQGLSTAPGSFQCVQSQEIAKSQPLIAAAAAAGTWGPIWG